MASCARFTNSGLTADQSLKRTAADNASLSGQQPEPIETIVLLSPSPEAPVCGLPVEHNDLTGSPEARQPPVHPGAANRPYLPRRKHRSKSGSVPAQRQRSNSIVSAGDSPVAPQPAALGLQLGTNSTLEDTSASSPEPADVSIHPQTIALLADWSPTPTPDTSPEPEALVRKVPRILYTTWCAERIILLAMYVVVGNSKLTDAGVRPFHC